MVLWVMARILFLVVVSIAGQVAAATPLEQEFKAACATLAEQKVKGSPSLVIGRDDWLLHALELRHASNGVFWGAQAAKVNPRPAPQYADPIPAIIDFAAQLEKRGIELLLMPVPVRPVIYPESVLPPEKLAGVSPLPFLNTPESQFFAELRAQGIKVLDLNPTFLAHRHDKQGPLFGLADTHWTPQGMILAAREVAEQIANKGWYQDLCKHRFVTKFETCDFRGGLHEKLEEIGLAANRELGQLSYRAVKLAAEGGSQTINLRNPKSPVVLIGDSYATWHRGRNASLAHQLAKELGILVDVLSTTGGGATDVRLDLIRTVRADPSYLAGKKLVIWCFGGRTLSTSQEGWMKIPIPPTK